MYLLVFITLVIGLIGIYAQVVSLQAARLASAMNGLGNNMIVWHNAAVSVGGAIVKAGLFPDGSVACSLTYTIPTGISISNCPAPTGSPDPYGVVMDNSNSYYHLSASDLVHLPAGFKTQFYSILYEDTTNSQNYVVTFLAKPTISASNPAPGFLALPPNNNLISFTVSDLLHQLAISNIPDYSFGTSKSSGATSILMSPGFGHGGTANSFQYNLPKVSGAGIINTGAAAIVSQATAF